MLSNTAVADILHANPMHADQQHGSGFTKLAADHSIARDTLIIQLLSSVHTVYGAHNEFYPPD